VLRPLARRFYARPPEVVARALLGRLLVREAREGRRVGRIVEVEAYGGNRDPASHAYRGPTPRNRTMFGRPGSAYIYVSYGIHHCLNVVTGVAGKPSAVLIRAFEPIAGLPLMEQGGQGTGRRRDPGPVRDPLHLARGPGLVTRALGLTLEHDGVDLTCGLLWLSAAAPPRGVRIACGPRIGIRRAVSRRWRFYFPGHPSVSGPRSSSGRRRGAGREGASGMGRGSARR